MITDGVKRHDFLKSKATGTTAGKLRILMNVNGDTGDREDRARRHIGLGRFLTLVITISQATTCFFP